MSDDKPRKKPVVFVSPFTGDLVRFDPIEELDSATWYRPSVVRRKEPSE